MFSTTVPDLTPSQSKCRGQMQGKEKQEQKIQRFARARFREQFSIREHFTGDLSLAIFSGLTVSTSLSYVLLARKSYNIWVFIRMWWFKLVISGFFFKKKSLGY